MAQSSIRRRAAFTFDNMKARCRFGHHKRYHRYGGRGIEVRINRDDFIAWYIQEAGGRLDLTIDRIDNDGHYELDNIQLITSFKNWEKAHHESEAVRESQSINLKKGSECCSVGVIIGGNHYPSLSEASRRLGFNTHYVSVRVHRYNSTMPNGEKIQLIGG